jgi:hypothetical protein
VAFRAPEITLVEQDGASLRVAVRLGCLGEQRRIFRSKAILQ